MSPIQRFHRVTLPALLPNALPGLANLWMAVTKDSALVAVVGYQELALATRLAGASTKHYFLFFLAAALLYLAITLVSNLFFKLIERRVRRGQPLLSRRCDGFLLDRQLLASAAHRSMANSCFVGDFGGLWFCNRHWPCLRSGQRRTGDAGPCARLFDVFPWHAVIDPALVALLRRRIIAADDPRHSSKFDLAAVAGRIFFAAVSFTLNYAAYEAEVLRGALLAVPKGELEAGRAFGMGRFTLIRRVWLPRAIRIALPTIAGEVVMQLKATPSPLP